MVRLVIALDGVKGAKEAEQGARMLARLDDLKHEFASIVDTKMNTDRHSIDDGRMRTLLQRMDKLDQVVDLIHDNVARTGPGNKNSKTKGDASEARFKDEMQRHMPWVNVSRCALKKNAGDYLIDELGKPQVLIELKAWSTSIPKTVVTDFHSDMKAAHTHGILISLESDIDSVEPFKPYMIGSLIAVCLPANHYDMEQVRFALNVIYALDEAHKNASEDDVVSFKPAMLANICNEIDKHRERISHTKSLLSQAVTSLDQIVLANIQSVLSTGYDKDKEAETTNTEVIKCMCGKVYSQPDPARRRSAYWKHKSKCPKHLEELEKTQKEERLKVKEPVTEVTLTWNDSKLKETPKSKPDETDKSEEVEFKKNHAELQRISADKLRANAKAYAQNQSFVCPAEAYDVIPADLDPKERTKRMNAIKEVQRGIFQEEMEAKFMSFFTTNVTNKTPEEAWQEKLRNDKSNTDHEQV
jgi:hypothetical protein